ncbi:MAG: protein kinase [Deltaproteobacteria bacterium]|nr:protein kinase [Deltaproteobacteria bacterium]
MVSPLLEGIPEPGEVLDGKYRIEQVLGVGGMGVVVAATHLRLDEKVAIKFLGGEAAKNEERVARFTREAWAAAKIKNDHVTRVSDVAATDGRVYLVMEYLEGTDLDASVAAGAMPVHMAVDYILQASEALAEAHKLGIVHRDLKPGNLFLTYRADGAPWIKVLDFGISKITAGGEGLTKTSALMGSPLYMAPEQLASSKYVDARADIWALGVILFQFVSGTTPFSGDTLPQVCTNVLHGEPLSLREASAELPPELAPVIERCLAKKPEDRYQNLAEFAEALAPFGTPAAWPSAEFIRKVLNVPASQRMPLDSFSGVDPRQSYSGHADPAQAPADTGRHAAVASAATVSHPDMASAQVETGAPPEAATSQPGLAGAVATTGTEQAAGQSSLDLQQPASQVAPVSGGPGFPQVAPQVGAVTAAPVSTTYAGSRRSTFAAAMIIGSVLAVAALGLVGILVFTGEESPAAETQPPAATEPPAPDEPAVGDEPVDEPDPTTPSSAEPASTASASAEPADSATPEVAPKPKRPWKPRIPKKPKEWNPYDKR